MKKIAILLTCFNRKKKTLSSLKHLFDSVAQSPGLQVSIYLTDDGSSDGTSEAVKSNYPKVKILPGTGSLYWAGGMRNSWKEALKTGYDGYLLLNDDTNLYPSAVHQLLSTHELCMKKHKQAGIYIGSTKDGESDEFTYGGAVFTNRFLFKYHFLKPNDNLQSCHLGNANIMLVSQSVVEKIDILTEGYQHGVADYDYTLKALKKKIPILIAPGYLGTCAHDHSDIYLTFHQKPFKERFRLLKHPLGLDFKSHLLLMRKHFPVRVPFILFAAGLKILLPKIYIKGRGKG